MSERTLDIITSFAGSLLVVLVLYYWKHVVRWLARSRRNGLIVYTILAAILVGSGAAQACFAMRPWLRSEPLSPPQLRIALYAFVAQLTTVYLIHRSIRYTVHSLESPQYSLPVAVTCSDPSGLRRQIDVRQLDCHGLKEYDRLYLNARTVFDGVTFLLQQIRNHTPRIQPDLCVGINHAGALISSYIAGSLGPGTTRLGFVATSGAEHDVSRPMVCLPPAGRPGSVREILLIDLEVKRGKSLCHVVGLLRDRYASKRSDDLTIKIAVLVASQVPCSIDQLHALLRPQGGVFEEDYCYLPDFLAFTCKNKVHIVGGVG